MYRKELREVLEKRRRAAEGGNETRAAVDPQPLGNAAMEEEINQGMAEQEEEAGEEQAGAEQLPAHLSDLAQRLHSSQKGGLGIGGNSERFERVEQKLAAVRRLLGSGLDQDNVSGNHKTILALLRAYQELDEACEVYVNRRALTKDGRNRQAIVAQILVHVKEDIKSLRAYFDNGALIPREERPSNIAELVERGRQRKLMIAGGKTGDQL